MVRSLTKTWSLAGLRAGYLLAPPGLVARLAEAQPLWSVSTPALAATEACCEPEALAEAEAWAGELAGHREALAVALSGFGMSVVSGVRASFVLVRMDGAGRIRGRLRERGIAVRRGDTFPGLGPERLRVAVRDSSSQRVLTRTLAQLMVT